jgi:hypothetical protein
MRNEQIEKMVKRKSLIFRKEFVSEEIEIDEEDRRILDLT